ncbi:GntR family transcriptional regulator [Rhodoferax aquaticus]
MQTMLDPQQEPATVASESASARAPLYRLLAKRLEQEIRTGHFRVDEALPPERELVASHGVSRVTARKAIDLLVAQGLVQRRHGSGNFIAPRLEQNLSGLTGFSEEMRKRGYQASSEWLDRTVRPGTKEECHSLGLMWPNKILCLERLRLADGRPVAYERTLLPRDALSSPFAIEESLYAQLSQTQYAPVEAKQHIRAMNANTRLAKLLHLRAGTALLWVTRTAYGVGGGVVECTVSYCRSDYYDFVVEMKRSHA